MKYFIYKYTQCDFFLFVWGFFAAKKKGKKGKTLTLTDFLAEDSGGSAVPNYTPTKPTSWADETDDLEGDGEHTRKKSTACIMLRNGVWLVLAFSCCLFIYQCFTWLNN